MDASLSERYSRQILFAEIGEQGQERLCASSAVLVGCGALGSAVANLLVRAGIGRLRILDRDFVEPSNLQRQTLFEEADAAEALPKAVAAQRRLTAVNSLVKVEGVVTDLSPANIAEALDGFPLILDGTDNFETRLLINDYAVSRSVPWIYSAVVGSYGLTSLIRPGETYCLACLTESGTAVTDPSVVSRSAVEPTCDTIGVLGAAAGVISSIEAATAIKFLIGKSCASDSRLVSYDVWSGRFQAIHPQRNPDCRACGWHRFSYLAGEAQPHLTMCGRDSVQIHERSRSLDLDALGRRLAAGGSEVRHNEFLLRFRVAAHEITVFADGRAIIKGTRDPAVARSLYARYIGS